MVIGRVARFYAILLHAHALQWDQVSPGNIVFFPLGICGTGETSYYGLVQPYTLTDPDKFFIEFMGGAVCFNLHSCLDRNIGVNTMSITRYLTDILHVPTFQQTIFKQGGNTPLAMMSLMKPGYLPTLPTHPLAGRRGIYILACNGDINVGRRNVSYPQTQTPVASSCNETMSGTKDQFYEGCQNYTMSGLPCQNWMAQTPHSHGMWQFQTNGLGNHNYCRNPTGSVMTGGSYNPTAVTIWCYTTDPSTIYELCDPIANSNSCNETISGNGYLYRGCQDRTRSGKKCQNWYHHSPHKHRYDTGNRIGNHNFCRNPDGESSIWCYTTVSAVRWDFCAPLDRNMGFNASHSGGANVHGLLEDTYRTHPYLTDIAVFGGSGGGVSSAAWLPMISDMWPMAQTRALVDSGLHIFPGTKLFQDFYDQSPWGPGPAGQGPGLYSTPVPDFDWRKVDALAKHISSFDGRAKIAYLSCIDDPVVFSDRVLMAMYAKLNETYAQLTSRITQHTDTWKFLNNLHNCTPQGSVYSYIQNCNAHHQTRQGYKAGVPNTISPSQFVDRFLQGLIPDPNNPNRTMFWFDDPLRNITSSECTSPVRRRRSPSLTSPPTTTTTTLSGVTTTTTIAKASTTTSGTLGNGNTTTSIDFGHTVTSFVQSLTPCVLSVVVVTLIHVL